VAAKLEEGDFRGAVRLASSSESFAPEDEHTLQILREKHPPAHSESALPPFLHHEDTITIVSSVVRKAIYSFPAGSAGGPDGLRPQHLKDILLNAADELKGEFMSALTSFVNLVADSRVPPFARPFFFGASLIGLNKRDGGVRPIAIGCTLRRLVAKCCTILIKEDMGALLFPTQLGYGTCHGSEAVVHAARAYLSTMKEDINPLPSSPLHIPPMLSHLIFTLVTTSLYHQKGSNRVIPWDPYYSVSPSLASLPA
jgi:hypothetical protein